MPPIACVRSSSTCTSRVRFVANGCPLLASDVAELFATTCAIIDCVKKSTATAPSTTRAESVEPLGRSPASPSIPVDAEPSGSVHSPSMAATSPAESPPFIAASAATQATRGAAEFLTSGSRTNHGAALATASDGLQCLPSSETNTSSPPKRISFAPFPTRTPAREPNAPAFATSMSQRPTVEVLRNRFAVSTRPFHASRSCLYCSSSGVLSRIVSGFCGISSASSARPSAVATRPRIWRFHQFTLASDDTSPSSPSKRP